HLAAPRDAPRIPGGQSGRRTEHERETDLRWPGGRWLDLPVPIGEAARSGCRYVVSTDPPAVVGIQAEPVEGAGFGGNLPALHADSCLEVSGWRRVMDSL